MLVWENFKSKQWQRALCYFFHSYSFAHFLCTSEFFCTYDQGKRTNLKELQIVFDFWKHCVTYNALKNQSCWYDKNKTHKRMMFSEIFLNHSAPNFTTCFMYIMKSPYQLYPSNRYVLTQLSCLLFFSFSFSFSPFLIKGNFFPAICRLLLESYL